MEFDTRRLYLGEGYPSLFVYCTKVLNYAEHAALNQIEVARAARRFPALLECVANGTVSLTGARVLAPHLTDDNCAAVLNAAHYKSKREIEEIAASLNPRPALPPTVRKLPVPAPQPAPAVAAPPQQPAPAGAAGPSGDSRSAEMSPPPQTNHTPRPMIEPLAPERYEVQFTITRETRDKLRKVQDLMRHTLPDGDLSAIFDRA